MSEQGKEEERVKGREGGGEGRREEGKGGGVSE